MAVTIKQSEEAPAAYPATPAGLSAAAAALPAAMIWARLESYIAHRWTVRDCQWIVEGPGDWSPPLAPATITVIEVWDGEELVPLTITPSPLTGYFLPGRGPYRFAGTVGAGTVPASVNEAFKRLAEYMAQKPGKAGASSESVSAGNIDVSYRRDPAWLAMALQNSGAADLLRNFRRAA